MSERKLPEGWEESTLGDCFEIISGEAFKKKEYSESGIRLLQIANVNFAKTKWEQQNFLPLQYSDSHSRLLLNRDDIVLALNRPILSEKLKFARIETSDLPAILYQRVARLRLKSDDDPHFLYYYFSTKEMLAQVEKRLKGSDQPYLNTSLLPSIEIPKAPPSEQKRIVARIEALQARSRAAKRHLNRVPALLDKLRQSVLAAAFRGDLTKEWRTKNPDVEPASALLERIKKERRQKWEEQQLATFKSKGKNPPKNWQAKYKEPAPVDTDGLPELPEGWCWASLDEFADVRLGRQRSPSRAKGEHMRKYVRAANVTWSGIQVSDVKEMDFRPDEFEIFRLQRGDILIVEGSGSASEVGKPAIWNGEIDECCFQNTLIRVRAPRPLVPYLFRHFQNDARSGSFARSSRGIGIHHIGAAALGSWRIALPPIQEVDALITKIQQMTDTLESIVRSAKFLNSRLLNVDQSVLSKAFRGKLLM